MSIELIIQNGSKLLQPSVEEGIVWETSRKGVPGKLTFKVIKDQALEFEEGNAIRFKKDGKNIFYGFVFTKKHDKNGLINVTAYDQLRYLKNKDTYVYTNKTAAEFIRMVAHDFRLNTGTIEDTGFKIASRVEDNKTLFDMFQNALDLTLENKKKMFILYDNFGKLTLRDIEKMKLDILLDEETGENFDYTSSIDSNTYNKIKLSYENEKKGKREIYIAQDGNHMNDWGVLQYFESIKENTNGKAKADALLALYNRKTRNLSMKRAFGNIYVRGGNMLVVRMNLGDIKLMNYMIVENVKHTFKESEHFMDLTLIGGDFVA
ncbi:hydrolase [Psychrobacillus sp. NEAU-3TGS]|uniref:XkdQ/YqbQ family protein n=1 Tax=Psychrobacillus sp. NEAU-3TGS TaxID=2995412 RepID=UPI0024973B21|nr:hydrolase [Psychrobacillus sp. NEAU-3TGS]MDI2588039.1 hydrolase [Psychrobacillus sp. NEAU-3TGS]